MMDRRWLIRRKRSVFALLFVSVAAQGLAAEATGDQPSVFDTDSAATPVHPASSNLPAAAADRSVSDLDTLRSIPPEPRRVVPAPTPRWPAEPIEPPSSANHVYYLDSYPINDLYQFLARKARLQFFHNPSLDQIRVTGELFKTTDPVESIKELALQYNLVVYRRGLTLYALTQDQLANLPLQEFRYELKYLHPAGQEAVQNMLGHFLTPDRGLVTYEPKVNMIVVNDNETAIRRVASYLSSIDRPRHQVSVQVRVLSINLSAAKNVGIDWSQTLGQQGLAITATAAGSLNAALGLASSVADIATYRQPGSSNRQPLGVTFGPVAVSAILRALYENGNATVENAPLVITEDNEPANINVVTRTPIVTSTVTTSNGTTDISNEVRYQIDAKDKTDPPQDRREIGTQLAVVPTLLPDGTIRLAITGTVATQVGQTTVSLGKDSSGNALTNTYPIINEAHLANLARVPNGYSLILGGFITENKSQQINKVPVLGNIPLVGAAFRSKQDTKQRTNLVFVITPTAYDAADPAQAVGINELNRQHYTADPNDVYADPQTIGHNAEIYPPELRQALSNPDEQEPDTNPLSPNNPENKRSIPVTTRPQREQKRLEQRYRRPEEVPAPRAYLVNPQPPKTRGLPEADRNDEN
ncbi:MAG: type II secretion system protein GspD [Verrucomicrobia bacterium]|nr:type II secretion system protein GspD [Verrucomicrobiota bacterium]